MVKKIMTIRNNFIEAIYLIFSNIKNKIYPLLMFVLGMLGTSSNYRTLVIIGFLIFTLYIIVTACLDWYATIGTINNNFLHYSSGHFVKKKHYIPLGNIKTMHFETTEFRKRLGLQTITLEIVGSENIRFTLRINEVNLIKSLLQYESQSNHIENKKIRFDLKKFSWKEYFLLTFSSKKWILIGLSTSWTLVTLHDSHYNNSPNAGNDSYVGIEGFISIILLNQFANLSSKQISYLIIILLGYVFVSLISAFMISTIFFATYSIYYNDGKWHVSQGIYKLKEQIVERNHIRSLVIKEPFIYRLFGFVHISLETIGTENNIDEIICIKPLLNKKNLTTYLSDTFPEIKNNTKQKNVKVTLYGWMNGLKSIGVYIVVIEIVSWTGILYLHWPAAVYLQGLLILIVGIFIQTLIHIREDSLTISTFLCKWTKTNWLTTITRYSDLKYIQLIKWEQTLLQQKMNSTDFIISIYSDKVSETYRVNNLSSIHNKEIMTLWEQVSN